MGKILIIDDEETQRGLYAFQLETDYEVRMAAEGAAGLETAKTFKPDLVILDVCMPGMGGFEVCRCIKEDPSLKGVRVLFITALQDEKSKQRAHEVHCDGYLEKPADPDLLRAAVKKFLGGMPF